MASVGFSSWNRSRKLKSAPPRGSRRLGGREGTSRRSSPARRSAGWRRRRPSSAWKEGRHSLITLKASDCCAMAIDLRFVRSEEALLKFKSEIQTKPLIFLIFIFSPSLVGILPFSSLFVRRLDK